MPTTRAFILFHCPPLLSYRQRHPLEDYALLFRAYHQQVEYPLKKALGDQLRFCWSFKTQLIYALDSPALLPTALQAIDESRTTLLHPTDAFEEMWSLRPNLKVAIGVGPAVPMVAPTVGYHSLVPERLPQLLNVGQHYERWLIVDEAAKPFLKGRPLSYLTRSYLEGKPTALEIWGNPH